MRGHAMKRPASSSAPAGGLAHTKKQRKKPKQAGRLQKLGLAVREFVEAAAGPGGVGGAPPQQAKPGGRRNRRELKRERRKLKRCRRRRLLLSGEGRHSQPASSKKKPPPPPPQQPAPGRQAPKASKPSATATERPRPGPTATSLARKRALLAANEAEEREIRRLERQLGLHKRRKKQAGPGEAALPQSFSRDGLGYVLGALAPGAAGSGLYASSDEEQERMEGEEEEGEEMEGDSEEEEGDSGGSEESDVEREGEDEEEEDEGESRGSRSPEAGVTGPTSPIEEKEVCRKGAEGSCQTQLVRFNWAALLV